MRQGCTRHAGASRLLVAGALCFALSAPASPEPRRSAVALGDCSDAQLRTSARSFHTALSVRTAESPQAMTEVLRSLRPQATKTFEELKRQLESAETQFYNASYQGAAEQVRDALAEIERVEPSPARWELQIQAHLLEALIFRGVLRTAEAEEACRKVLRLSPDYQLDTNFFSPSVTAFFNRVRKQVAAAPKARLVVTSSPPGADVYLDGRMVGRTPFTGSFLPGPYQLMLARGEGWSFPRNVQLGREHDTVVTVDLSFEGSVLAGEPPCLLHLASSGDPFKYAVKYGALIGADEIVVLRQQKKGPGAGWVTASLLSVQGGQTVREGSLQTSESGELGPSGDDLVHFVVTGKATAAVKLPPPNPRRVSVDAPPLAAAPAPAAAAALPPARAAPSTRALQARWGSYVAGGVALAMLGTAGWLWGSAQDSVEILEDRGGTSRALRTDDAEGARLYAELRGRSRVITGLLVGGGVAAATSGALFLWSLQPEPSAQLGVAASPSGAAVRLRARF